VSSKQALARRPGKKVPKAFLVVSSSTNTGRVPRTVAPCSAISPFFNVPVSRASGKVFLRDVLRGLINNSDWSKTNLTTDHLKSLNELASINKRSLPPIRVEINFQIGAPGCGKSYAFANALRSFTLNSSDFAIATPRNPLREKWDQDLDLGALGWRVQTLEKFFCMVPPAHIFLDEFSLFPKGFLSAYLTYHSHVTHVSIMGDPGQVAFHALTDALVEHLPGASAFDEVLPRHLPVPYMFYTRRLAIGVATSVGIPTSSEQTGSFIKCHILDPRLPTLFPGTAASSTSSMRAYTYTLAQGQDFDSDYQLVLTNDCLKMDYRTLWVAMTRGKKNVLVYNQLSLNETNIHLIKRNPFLRCLIFGTHFEAYDSLRVFLGMHTLVPLPFTPTNPNAITPFSGGRTNV